MNNQSSSASCSSSTSDSTSRINNQASSSLPAQSSLRPLRAGIRRSLLPSRPPMLAPRSLEALGLRSSNSSLHPDRPVRSNQRDILNAALAVIHADDDFLAQLSSSSNPRNKKRKLQRGGPPRQ
ncbi:unnamed protein product [Cylindrotheca closterium]|uniref:Uncharacterized protein n=1 Tax=Cylindrotheca closterium TaxID=2856 RepID=A0AAD2CXD9_9STRA|nr:unnamed protein product [Cylindrotheca closterium]